MSPTDLPRLARSPYRGVALVPFNIERKSALCFIKNRVICSKLFHTSTTTIACCPLASADRFEGAHVDRGQKTVGAPRVNRRRADCEDRRLRAAAPPAGASVWVDGEWGRISPLRLGRARESHVTGVLTEPRTWNAIALPPRAAKTDLFPSGSARRDSALRCEARRCAAPRCAETMDG